jgi:hypothetical protein
MKLLGRRMGALLEVVEVVEVAVKHVVAIHARME